MFGAREGTAAVHLARWAIEGHVRGIDLPQPESPETFTKKAAAFVTINTYPEGELRGCIGYHAAILALEEAVVRAAVSACYDPRFPPLETPELDRVVAEVSLLSSPLRITAPQPREYPQSVTVGRDGLLVQQADQTGLLLPQVPVEWGWDATEFLSQACMKAGLLPDAWFEPALEIFTFQAEIFGEVSPRGTVRRRELHVLHDGHHG